MSRSIAVIGGGPAGSVAARTLAELGEDVTLFHANPRHGEKPCGGGVTLKTFDAFPWLADLNIPRNEIVNVRLVAPNGRVLRVSSPQPLFITFARAEFDQALRDEAAKKGAKLILERVSHSQVRSDGVHLTTENSGDWRFSEVILADGAFSSHRKTLFGEMSPTWLLCPAMDIITTGIPRDAGVTLVFFPDVTGYLWVFPNQTGASVGIVSRPGELSGAEMKLRIQSFLSANYPGAVAQKSMGWVIPAIREPGLVSKVTTERCILVGDAAGLADPITGEGIYYAMRSGELAGRALHEGNSSHYPQLLEREILPELDAAADLATRYFRRGALDMTILCAKWHRGARNVVTDLLMGMQPYSSLRARVEREFPWLAFVLKRTRAFRRTSHKESRGAECNKTFVTSDSAAKKN